MTPSSNDPDAKTPTASSSRLSFERLRERTDELELIISGLTTVALFALPGWLLDRYALLYPKMPLAMIAGSEIVMIMVIGLCYVLGALFATHVGIRAYWVGLIGLKTVFPEGIRWDAAHSYGPISRRELKRILPDIDSAIDRADQAASTLFAVIALGALTSLWAAIFITLLLTGAVLIGLATSAPAVVSKFLILGAAGLVVGSAMLLWLLDAVLAARFPRLAASRTMHKLVLGLRLIVRTIQPERLIVPVQLTLQTNTRPRLFIVGFTAAMLAIPMIGVLQFRSHFDFEVFGTSQFVDNDDFLGKPGSMMSRYYESQLQPRDLLRLGPLIPDSVLERSWMPLFLPYFPLHDDRVLERLCAEPEVVKGAACLQRIWKVELNGRPVKLDGFIIAERRDLGFRGLQGWIALERARPGPQRLHVVWNPDGDAERKSSGGRPTRIEHHIPFLLAPEWGQ